MGSDEVAGPGGAGEADGYPNVRLWMQALRSGRYEQTNRYLTVPAVTGELDKLRHCCLGVACELAVASGIVRRKLSPYGRKVEYGGHFGMHATSTDWSETRLPIPVLSWLGVQEAVKPAGDRIMGEMKLYLPPDLLARAVPGGGFYEDEVGAWSWPSYLNDSLDFTFDEIADCIEFTFFRSEWEARHGKEGS